MPSVRVPVGQQNLFDQIGYLVDPSVANAESTDLRLSLVRLGAGGATGGAATWNQVDTTNPLDPYYPVQQAHDNIERAVALEIPRVIVNVSPYRRTDLAVTITTLTASILDTTSLGPFSCVNATNLPVGYLIQIDSEQMVMDVAVDPTHFMVRSRGANDTTAATHANLSPITRQTTTAQYPVDATAYLAWLQTSVAPLAQRTDIEVLFQVLNEPMNAEFWVGSQDDYGLLAVNTGGVLKTYGAPGQRILLAGMTAAWTTAVIAHMAAISGVPATTYFDILDFHQFGIPDMAADGGNLDAYWTFVDALAAYRAAQAALGIALIPIWFTEVAVPSGTPTDITGTPYPGTPYSEEQQARDSVKRMLYPLASQGTAPPIEVTTWAYLPDTTPTPSPPANTYFEHVGLRNVTPFTKKLAYWTLAEAAEVMSRLGDWTVGSAAAVDLASEAPWVRVLTAPDASGRTAFVIWYDFFRSSTPQTGVTVTLRVAAEVTQVAVRPLVAARANGTLVIPSDFDPTYYAASGGTVTVPIDRNPWSIEVSAYTTATATTRYGPTRQGHVRARTRRVR